MVQPRERAKGLCLVSPQRLQATTSTDPSWAVFSMISAIVLSPVMKGLSPPSILDTVANCERQKITKCLDPRNPVFCVAFESVGRRFKLTISGDSRENPQECDVDPMIRVVRRIAIRGGIFRMEA